MYTKIKSAKMIHMKKWYRIAGHSANMKEDRRARWQLYEKEGDEIIALLYNWRMKGEVTKKNFIPDSSSARDKNGLLSWIDIYAHLEIDGEHATFVL